MGSLLKAGMFSATRSIARVAPRIAQRRGFAEAAASNNLNFSLLLPDRAVYDKQEVSLVIVPASNGAFGIMKDHVPTVAQLDAGVLTVHQDGNEDKFFVSGGFAIVREDGADVCAVEAVRVDDLDASAVSAGLADANAKLASATDETAKAEAQISISTYLAMQGAINAN